MKRGMMKWFCLIALVTVGAAQVVEQDRTITKVVKLLKDMMDKSIKEGDEERVIFAKFKCYCDTSEAEKKASIKQLTEQIELLESEIAEIQGSTGGLSEECADLKRRLAENKMAQDEATSIREKEKKAFDAEEADLEQAIKQMSEAIKTLGEVGADQTKSVGADHKQFMAGFGEKDGPSLLSVKTQVDSALRIASELMTNANQKKAAAFLQSPFTGTYTSQSAEVMGILKNMRDTFTKNLAEARATEKERLAAYKRLMKILTEAQDEMTKSYESKQEELGGNDLTLANKKQQLADAKKQKASDEVFLEKLIPMCKDKTSEYDKRKILRANEETAIAEAISILNSDAAFATYGTVDATSSRGGALQFIQLRAVHKHMSGKENTRKMIQQVLQNAAKDANSARLSKVLAKVQAENPFDEVLDEIDKMLELIKEEAKQDKENLDWCYSERDENHAEKKKLKGEMESLEEGIDELDKSINHPKTGLKTQIAEREDALEKNNEAQKTETASRLEENIAYQKDVKNLVDAEKLVEKAIKVLKAYYEDLEKKAMGTGFIQEDPAPPSTWDNKYAGQSKEASGEGGVIVNLEVILDNTKLEEKEAHSDEEQAQHEYEDSMTALKEEQKKGEKNLASLQEQLAEAEKDLTDAEEDLKKTTAAHDAVVAYLLKIKPGCDFITENFDLREQNRGIEEAALEKAIKLIKGTPAYKTAVEEATVESYGKCKEPCVEDADDVKCKACRADVTIPAYCAGHEGTNGC